MTGQHRSSPGDAVVVGVFVMSGAAGLMYQVVWSSQLVLVFGNTTEAVGAIVTAFMAGLGFGGLAGGLLAPRLRQPLRLYGLVELAVGASALLVPLGFHGIDGAYRSVFQVSSASALTLIRLGLTLAIVTPVTFLMGLTLPLLTRYLVTSMRTAGAHMGTLYSANTLGAMGGSLLSGFVLIELLGLSSTAHVAVVLNLLAGCVALLIGTRQALPVLPGTTSDEHGDGPEMVGQRMRLLIYGASFVSGFVALGLEVLWTRLLAEGTGSQIYDFVAILATFLCGVAAGGAMYRGASRPDRDTPQMLGLAFLGIALSTAVTVPLGTLLPIHSVARAVMLLPATTCMGYAFPLAARLVSRDPAQSARGMGLLYAWNTLGAILGTLAAGFVLTATLGTNNSILALGAIDAAVALALTLACSKPARPALPLSAGTLTIAPLLLVITGSPLAQTATQHELAGDSLPHYHAEDRVSTVDAVGGAIGNRRLYASGTSMTYLSVDTKLMAYVPKVMRPQAQDFLDICFGMGTTFRSAILLGMHADAVDLSPSIPQMMPVFYDDAGGFLQSPLGRIVTADGRNYVRLTQRQYDLISVDPPPPIQTAGAAVLYSREFYADAHRTLRPGGLMLQWLYFGVDLEQLREHVRTFRSQFPHVSVLISPRHGGLYLLGSDAPIAWDAATVSRVLDSPEARLDFQTAPDASYLPDQPWPAILDGMRWLQDDDVDRFVGQGPMITDDQPRTAYYALHMLSGSGPLVNDAMLRELWPGPKT